MKALINAWLAAIAFAMSSSASAQAAEKRESAAPSIYRSVFSDYRGMVDDKVEWKEANDTVARIGGWRTYLRQSRSPDPTPEAKPPAPAAAPAKAGAAHRH